MQARLSLAFANTTVAEIEDRYHWLLDVRLNVLLWFSNLRGSDATVQDFELWEKIPDHEAEQIAVSWLRKGRVMTRSLRVWIERMFHGQNPTLAELLEAAMRRTSTNRVQTLTDLQTVLSYLADAYPFQTRLDEMVQKVHAAHAKVRARMRTARQQGRLFVLS